MKFLLKYILFLFFIGCAGIAENPAALAGAGAVGSEVVRKVVESAPKFNPYLKIQEFEVCIASKNNAEQMECTLVLSHDKRTLSKERLNEDDTVFIKKESLLYLMSEIEVFCKHNHKLCKEKSEEYKEIKRVFIF